MAQGKVRVKTRVFNIVVSIMKHETPTVSFRPGGNCSDTYSVHIAPDSGFSNSAVDRRFSTPVAAAVDGNLSKVMEKMCRPMLCNIVPISGCLS